MLRAFQLVFPLPTAGSFLSQYLPDHFQRLLDWQRLLHDLPYYRVDVELNGGLRDSQQLDDLKDCVSGVKDLLRIKAMAPSVAAK